MHLVRIKVKKQAEFIVKGWVPLHTQELELMTLYAPAEDRPAEAILDDYAPNQTVMSSMVILK